MPSDWSTARLAAAEFNNNVQRMSKQKRSIFSSLFWNKHELGTTRRYCPDLFVALKVPSLSAVRRNFERCLFCVVTHYYAYCCILSASKCKLLILGWYGRELFIHRNNWRMRLETGSIIILGCVHTIHNTHVIGTLARMTCIFKSIYFCSTLQL